MTMGKREPQPTGEPVEPFDPVAWRRKYMKLYMQKRRDRIRAEKAAAKAKQTGL